MNHTAPKKILSIALFVFTVGICAQAQPAVKLTGEEAQLVAGSKRAILATGFSEPYFEEHFQLVKVTNQSGDRRVLWKYSINEYEVTLNDAVGFYSAQDGQRVNTHSIREILGSAHDIKKTIPRKQAEQIMTRCIGKHSEATVIFKALTAQGNATLFLVASPAAKKRVGTRERERDERRKEEGEKKARKNKTPAVDKIEEDEDEGGGPSYFGNVNLETGRCTKGKASTAKDSH